MELGATVLAVFLVFCRTGACLMIVPGLSTARVPAQVRLFLALALALLVAPLVESDRARVVGPPDLVQMILAETITGAVLGFGTRLLIEALELAGAAIANMIGLTGLAGSLDGGEPDTSLSSLVTMSGVMMLMLLDLPQAVVVGVVDSYAVLPLGASPSATTSLDRHAGLLAAGLVTSVQVAAPFLVYAVVVNGLFAVLGRMVPQIQSYFLSGPFLAIGGLALLYLVFGEIMRILMEAVPARAWL